MSVPATRYSCSFSIHHTKKASDGAVHCTVMPIRPQTLPKLYREPGTEPVTVLVCVPAPPGVFEPVQYRYRYCTVPVLCVPCVSRLPPVSFYRYRY